MSDSNKRIEKLSPLKRALFAVEEMRKKLEKIQNEKREPIAVIGIGCKFPKANGVNEYWDLLVNGIDAISKVPKERWDIDKFYSSESGEKGKMTTRYGGFLEDIDKFDPQFFSISPREAAGMDPQQRLLLEVVWEAFEYAGLKPSSLRNSKSGVFIGISNNDYSKLPKNKFKYIDAYSGSGNAFSIAANRISYLLDFRGPSIAVDTACSSSLVTIHMAIQSLRNKESDLAVAGGVNLTLSPELTVTFSQAHMMSPSGHCKTFSADADGYVRGEGCGVVILKRLSDAIKNSDNILAVIKGSAVNQDGKSNGLTAPNSFAQKNVILNALENAKLKPEDIQYIETHGTGTILGDPIEVQALGMVMDKRGKDNPCYLGAVKTNIGHLESAAGIAGFIKTVLILKNQTIPKNLNFNQINPHIPIDELPFEIPTETIKWKSNGALRRAGVSSFGFGGTNAHIVLEEYQKSDKLIPDIIDRDYHLFTISAKSDTALVNLVGNYKTFLTKNPLVNLGDFCFSANCHREHFEERVSFVAGSIKNLSEKLDNFLSVPNDYVQTVKKMKNRKIAFLFTGQGSQYFGMGKDLYNSSPTFKKHLDKCNDILLPLINESITDILFRDNDKSEQINMTAFTQPALFAIEYALAKLWISWGIKPDYVIGHSVGEYTAATIAGLFSLEDGLKLIAKRGRLMQALPQEGDMVVIFKNFEFVNIQIKEFSNDLSIAGVNGPENTVVSGKRDSLSKLLEKLDKQNIDYRKLTVSHAFHSPLMEPVLDEFESTANSVEYSQPAIPIVSNVTGEIIINETKLNAIYWRNHIRKPVLFEPGIKKLAETGVEIFLEVGPNPTLIGMAKRFLIDQKYIWIGSLKKKMNDWESILNNISAVYLSGIEFNWQAFDSDYKREFINIPTYPFLKERYWFKDVTNYIEDYSVSQKEQEKVKKEKGSWNETVEKLRSDLENTEIDKKVVLNNFIIKQIAKVLKLSESRIKLNQPITNFGLDSILAMELRAKLFEAIKIELPISKLIEGPSIEDLSEYLAVMLNNSGKKNISSIEILDAETGQFPLSYGQKAMWFQHKMAPGSIFNPAYAVEVKTKLDVKKLKSAFDTIIKRHPQLRTTFSFNNNEPMQIIHASALEYFSEVNLSDLNDDQVKQRLENEANKQFDLEKGPLFKVFVFHTNNNKSIILMVSHHIVVDMWSQAIIVNEVDTLYPTGTNGVSLSEEHAKYSDFIFWQKNILENEIGSKLYNYWQNELSGELPVLDLPIDKQRPAVQTFNGATKTVLLDQDLSRQLKKLSENNDTTLFVTLLSAFKVLLNKYTRQKDIIVGTPTTGRSVTEIENTIGYFVNPVAIRSNINEDESFSTYLKKVQNKVIGAIEHQDYPINLLVEKLQPSRDTSRTPVFQVMFVYQKAQLLADEGLSGFSLSQEGSSLKLGGLPLESIILDDKKAPFEITLMMAQTGKGLGASITYNTDLFLDISIDKMLDRFKIVLQSIVEQPNIKISDIQLLNNKELDTIINRWNNSFVPQLNYKNIIEWFHKQVEISPDNRAVVFNNRSITFNELNEKSNQLANYLIKKGIKPDQLIGICIERSIEMIISVLAVLKAGGAYVPIDYSYPSERIHYIISNAELSTILTLHSYSKRLSENGAKHIYIDIELEEISKQSVENIHENVFPENLVYAIYTSGSTGNPKGVLLTHKGLMNLVYAQIQRFQISSASRILQFASFSFDASVSEIFTSLLSGAELHLIRNEELLSGMTILNKIKNEKITNCTLPPSVLKVLSKEELPNLEVVVSAGETCSKEIVLTWANGRKFINAYGPTESTVCATCNEIKTIPDSNLIPIGRPVDNVKIYILDNYLKPVPIGLPGELYIGGLGLARGYQNRPDLTAERFLPNPFTNSEEGERMYKSGDLAKFLPDGRIEFLGRIDNQVKFRGFRIELEEIEAHLNKHPNIQHSLVIARKAKNREQKLVAYYVTTNETNGKDLKLKDYLHKHLPDFMIPSSFIKLDKFPLTPNNKIDRNALPEIQVLQTAGSIFIKPQSGIEKQIAEIWKEILGVEKVGLNDNFFDLGGHSLNVIQVQTKIKENFDKEISVVDLFKYPTVKSFADYLTNGNSVMEAFEEKLKRSNMQKGNIAMQRERMKLRGKTK